VVAFSSRQICNGQIQVQAPKGRSEALCKGGKRGQCETGQNFSLVPNVAAIQVAKKLVNSDFKNNRVEDPTKICEKQQKKVKKFCKEYFDKAVAKHRAYEQKKAERLAKEGEGQPGCSKNGDSKPGSGSPLPARYDMVDAKDDDSDDDDVKTSDDEVGKTEGKQFSPAFDGECLKRKRAATDDRRPDDRGVSPSKRQKSSTPTPTAEGHPAMDLGGEVGDSEEYHIRSRRDGYDEEEGAIPPPPPPPPPPPMGVQTDEDDDIQNDDDDETAEMGVDPDFGKPLRYDKLREDEAHQNGFPSDSPISDGYCAGGNEELKPPPIGIEGRV
jgi:[histone H3]-lysine36 N-trimethyltransferase